MDFPPITELIPHSGPMVYLDRILSFDNTSLVAECTVSRHHGIDIFGNSIEAIVGIEYLSQAAAAFSVLERPKPHVPQFGYLVSIRRSKMSVSHFQCGERLTVTLHRDDIAGGLTVFLGSVLSSSGQELIQAQFGVYSPGEKDVNSK